MQRCYLYKRLWFCNVMPFITMATNTYYAVGRGRITGVYNTWPECQTQVQNIKNARYRKFSNLKEAWDFVKEFQNGRSPKKTPVKDLKEKFVTEERSTSPSLLGRMFSSSQSIAPIFKNNEPQPTYGVNLAQSQPVSLTMNRKQNTTVSSESTYSLRETSDSIYCAPTQFLSDTEANTHTLSLTQPVLSTVNDSQNNTYKRTMNFPSSQPVHCSINDAKSIANSDVNMEHIPVSQKESLPWNMRLVQLEERHERFTKQFSIETKEMKNKFEELQETITMSSEKIFEGISCILNKIGNMDKHFSDCQVQLKTDLNQLDTMKACKSNHDNIPSTSKSYLQSSVAWKKISQSILNIEKPTITNKRKASSSCINSNDDIKEVPVPQKKVIKVELADSGDEADGSSTLSQHNFEMDDEGYVIVYTDGACENNGQYGAKAGIGIWFGDNHPLNCSEPVQGRATNNVAEIQAAAYAIDIAKKAGVKNLLVNTDSQFLINCITKWIHKWKLNNWKLVNGEPVKNKVDILVLDEAMKDMVVKWFYVRGHNGIHGNEMADALAKSGALRYGGLNKNNKQSETKERKKDNKNKHRNLRTKKSNILHY